MRNNKHYILLNDRDVDGPFTPSEDEFITGDRASVIGRDNSVSNYTFFGDIDDSEGKFHNNLGDFEDSLPKVLYGEPEHSEVDLMDGAKVTLKAEVKDKKVTVTQTLVFSFE